MIHVYHPLSAARKNKAVIALRNSKNIRIGGCSLFPEDGMIWGVDAYGMDRIAASSNDEAGIQQAINWANHELTAPPGSHPAERVML